MAKSYSDKLKDPRWQKKRLKILERDNWACRFCDDTEETLHVHHLSYEGKKYPWEVSDDSLITYCETCHSVIEDAKKYPSNYLPVTAIKLNNSQNQVAVIYDCGGEKTTIVYDPGMIGVTVMWPGFIDKLNKKLQSL